MRVFLERTAAVVQVAVLVLLKSCFRQLTRNMKHLSVESRSKTTYGKATKPVLAPVPGTPSRKYGTQSRPRTPVTPRKGAESPLLMPLANEMDVSNVDPEQVLVDYQTIEPGDVSSFISSPFVLIKLNLACFKMLDTSRDLPKDFKQIADELSVSGIISICLISIHLIHFTI